MTLFPWFTNAAAFDLTFLLAITSFAVMVWANRYHREYSVFVKTIAPLLAGIGMAAVSALILINFNLMMDTEDFSMIWMVLLQTRVFVENGGAGTSVALHTNK